MLDDLKFVKGAVARKDFVPELTHFKIAGGRIYGYNGRMALSSPIDLDLEVYPKADKFVKAIESCRDETTKLHVTNAGRLSIKSGAFKALVSCVEGEGYPVLEPEGQLVDLPDTFLKALQALEPVIGDDASRPWSNGVLIRNCSAYATNNVVLAQYWIGVEFPYELNIPGKTIRELLRIRTPITGVQIGSESVTFHFEGNRWLRSQLKDNSWPDVDKVLAGVDSSPVPLPDGFYEALESVQPFVAKDNRVYFHSGGIGTLPAGQEDEMAHVAVEGLPEGASFNLKMLQCIRGLCERIDFTTYPKPCTFYGDQVRGAIVGMR